MPNDFTEKAKAAKATYTIYSTFDNYTRNLKETGLIERKRGTQKTFVKISELGINTLEY